MKDPVYIVRTKFIDIMTDKLTMGYRIYDDNYSEYCNSLEDMPEDDMELLKIVNDNSHEILSNVLYLKIPVDIDGNLYQYNDISDVFVLK